MKKFLSLILALLTLCTLAAPAYAKETVDNTFDNFTPAPGTKAPDNWYDPYCYESDGRINQYCLNQGGSEGFPVAMYCPEYKRIFTLTAMGRTTRNGQIYGYRPYEVYCPDWHIYSDVTGEIVTYNSTQWYCPYCGKYYVCDFTSFEDDQQNSAIYSHLGVNSVVYTCYCDECDSIVASNAFAQNTNNASPFAFKDSYVNYFSGCDHTRNINEEKLYRFTSDEQKNAEYSFIFKETEANFGNGKDGNIEDLKQDSSGAYEEWDSPDNPFKTTKLSFWQKIINVFKNFFSKITSFFGNLF